MSPPIDPVRTEFCFEAQVDCEPPRVIGASSYGTRQLIPIVGGTFAGEHIRGDVLPGGADWQIIRSDGVVEVEARYTLRAEDGGLISVVNRGVFAQRQTPPGGAATTAHVPYARTVPRFEAASNGPHAWLNQWMFVATLGVLSFSPLRVQVRVFRVV